MKEVKMEQIRDLPHIRAVLMEKAKALRELSNQAFHLENQIRKIAGSIYNAEEGVPKRKNQGAFGQARSNIIPFPKYTEKAAPVREFQLVKYPFLVPILAKPGHVLPDTIPDFRPLLQRDGLILLSWDRRLTEGGERFTVYWVTSSGVCRYYASPALDRKAIATACPVRKSYAAEDGIEFYGQGEPSYVVHVAPELMMSCSDHENLRPEHIRRLKALGVTSDFDYRFVLTREKKKLPAAGKSSTKRQRNDA
jgi:hypothetical protein